MKDIIFTKYTNERNAAYRIITQIVRDNGVLYVEKLPAAPQAKAHIEHMYESYEKLKQNYGKVFGIAECSRISDGLRFEYVEGRSMETMLDELIEKNDMKGILELFRKIRELLVKVEGKTEFKPSNDFERIFGTAVPREGLPAHSFANLDMMLSNLIVKPDGKITIIDYEWCVDFAVPDDYVLYRMIYNHAFKYSELMQKDLLSYIGISDDDKKIYQEMEKSFIGYLFKDGLIINELYRNIGKMTYDVKSLEECSNQSDNKCAYQIYYNMGEGYSEENSVFAMADADKRISVRIPIKEGVKEVRFDPACKSGTAQNIEATAYSSNGRYRLCYTANGDCYEDVIFFKTDDPQIVFGDIEADTKYIDISYDYRACSEAEAQALSMAVHDMRVAVKQNEEKDILISEKENNISELKISLKQNTDELNEAEKNNKLYQHRVNELTNKVNSLDVELQNKNDRIEALELANRQLENSINNVQAAAQLREMQFNEIKNSRIWRYTMPVRKFTTALRANTATRLFCKGLLSLKNAGLKETLNRVSERTSAKPIIDVKPLGEVPSGTMALDDIKLLDSFDKKIAVHLHLYYVDLLDEFFSYFDNIPYSFDLYVSCKGGSDIKAITKKFKKLRHVGKVDVRETINRGRDIAPLYVQFAPEIEKYDYFLHVHSKKSLFTGKEQYGWRQHSLDCLLGDELTVKRVFALMESDKKVGLFYPETFGDMHMIAQSWLANSAEGRRMLNEFGIEFDDCYFNYPVGSFFWAKMEAVKPLFDKKFKYEDFPEEAGQTDGTIAHALERVIAWVVRSRGFIEAIYDVGEPFVRLGKSYKVYESYYKLDYEAVQYHLSLYDLVSFDIFDTLITRMVYEPDDLFELMRVKLERELNIKCDFLAARKEAERLAWNEKKSFTNINDIYSKLPQVLDISQETAERIKNIEIELELELCIPREDMVRCFNFVKACGKRIVLVSDMYLTSDIVTKMLEKCGITGYEQLWISCERGKRKDDDTIWSDFYEQYGELKTVHVGDNPRSDIQIVGDKAKMTFLVINPRMAFKQSQYYETFKKYIKGSILDRLLLGMFINGCVYNSPFCQGIDGEPVINSAEEFGYAAYGSLFAVFSLWLTDMTSKESILMFLAREGYLFEQVYNNVLSRFQNLRRDSRYTLASRRAVSFASVRSAEDIRKIIGQYYDGMLDNMLKSRLGIELYPDIQNRHILMNRDLETVMNELEPHMEDILARAAKEREAYEAYLNELNVGNEGILVDVGYSGTIQYFMAKLRNNKQSGLYLCKWVDFKPAELGCCGEALYPVLDRNDEHTHKIFKNQLFLEAVLKAPYGQLVRFDLKDGSAEAVYKEDSELTAEVKAMQEGILSFSKVFGQLIGAAGFIDKADSALAADIFDVCINGGWLGEKMINMFEVQDDYCSNGRQSYDPVQKKWLVK